MTEKEIVFETIRTLPDEVFDTWDCRLDIQFLSHKKCRELKRINVSAAFFLSIEFQETGFLAYRMYKTAYGDTTSPNVAIPVPIVRFWEFLTDAQRIGRRVVVNVGVWQVQLETNKTDYAREFVVTLRKLVVY